MIRTPSHPLPAQPPKDHEVCELVSRLTEIAKQFHSAQQLRERIAQEIRPFTLTQPTEPVVGVPAFPERIMRQLIIMTDRVGDEFYGPWEDGNGEPLQDDADAAIAWIASAQPQQKEG